MNLKEGLRRAGITLSGLVALGFLAGYGADAPTQSALEWKYRESLTTLVHESMPNGIRPSSRYETEVLLWPKKNSAEIIDWICKTSTTHDLTSMCTDFDKAVDGLLLTWVKHAFLTLLVGAAAGLVFLLFWNSFSWALLGFTLPK